MGRFKKGLSASHIMLYAAMLIYFIVVAFAICVCIYILVKHPDSIDSVCILGGSMITLVSAVTGCVATVYSNKAQKDHEIQYRQEIHDGRLDFAKQTSVALHNGEVDDSSIKYSKYLSTDTQTDVNIIGGTPVVTELTQYPEENIDKRYTVDSILREQEITSIVSEIEEERNSNKFL